MSGGKHLDSEERRVRREETKAYLNRVREMETERQTLMDYRRITQEWLEGAGSDPSRERVDESRDVHSMDKLLELDAEIEKRCRELLAGARNIQEIIQAIPSSRHRTLLMSRYLLGESQQAAQDRLFISERTYFRWHTQALEAAEKVIEKKMALNGSSERDKTIP